jgi:hypothetical protein
MPTHVSGGVSACSRSCGRSCQLSRTRWFERLATHGHHPPAGLYVCNEQSFRLSCSPWTRTVACRGDHYCSQRYARSSAEDILLAALRKKMASQPSTGFRQGTNWSRSTICVWPMQNAGQPSLLARFLSGTSGQPGGITSAFLVAAAAGHPAGAAAAAAAAATSGFAN